MTEAVDPVPLVLPDSAVPNPLPQPLNLEAELTKQQRKLNKDRAKSTLLNRSLELKNTVRMSFSLELNKLDMLETRETALRAIKTLFEGNRNREALKLFLTALATPKTQSAKGRCAELKVVQMLLKVFGEMLIEAAGAGLNRIYGVLLGYFSDRSREVQEAVADCLCVLYNCALPLGPGKSLQFLLEPLTLVLTSGTEISAQQTASVTLRTWLCSLPRDQTSLITDAAKRITALFLKLRPGYPDLISTLGYLVQYFGVEFLLPDLLMVVKRLLAYFGLMTSQSGYFGEKEACKLLGQIVKRLDSAVSCLGELKQEVIERLREAKSHKVADVQREAAIAYTLWTGGHSSLSPRPPLTRLRTVRDAIKRGKTEEASPPPEDQWGVYRSKFLTRGSGRYVPQLGYGRLDLSKALKSRPSIRDFIRSKGKSATGKIEIYTKSPTEASRIVPRRGFGEAPEEPNIEAEEPSGAQAEELIDSQALPQAEDTISGAGEGMEDEAKEEEKQLEEGEEVASFQPFQVEAPGQSTETANPRLWNRLKGAEKKPEPEAVIEPLPDPEAPPSEKPSSGQSSSRLKKAVAKSSILRKFATSKHSEAAPGSNTAETPESQATIPEVPQPASSKSNSSALFGLLGKSILGKLNSSRSPKELGSPKDSGKESLGSASGTLAEELAASSGLESSPKASIRTPEAIEEQHESEELDASGVDESGQYTEEVVEWISTLMTRSIDQMNEQFQQMEKSIQGMETRISKLEGETAYQLHRYRARNAAQPRYKSHIHPPQSSPPTLTHTTTQTRPFTRSHSSQTAPIPPAKKPAIDPLTKTWTQSLSDLRNKQTQRAYRRVLRTGDDLYLIRLMVTTGAVVRELNEGTVGTVLERMSQLLSQSFVAGVMLDWVAESVQTGLFFEASKEEQHGLLAIIEAAAIEDTEDGLKARGVYDYLTSN